MEPVFKKTAGIPADAKSDVKIILIGDSAVGKSKYAYLILGVNK